MGQKLPGFILHNQTYKASWYSSQRKDYVVKLIQDLKIREYLNSLALKQRWILADVFIENTSARTIITITTLKPGVIMGKGGANIESLKSNLSALINRPIEIIVKPVAFPDLNAACIAHRLAQDLQQRRSCKISMKKYVKDAMHYGARGVAIQVSGRINGREIASTMRETSGSMPRHNLRESKYIDYIQHHVKTIAGLLGVKVWVLQKKDDQ